VHGRLPLCVKVCVVKVCVVKVCVVKVCVVKVCVVKVCVVKVCVVKVWAIEVRHVRGHPTATWPSRNRLRDRNVASPIARTSDRPVNSSLIQLDAPAKVSPVTLTAMK